MFIEIFKDRQGVSTRCGAFSHIYIHNYDNNHGTLYIFGKPIFVFIQGHTFYLDRLKIIRLMNLKLIFSLLFFEHRFLTDYPCYGPEVFCVVS